MDAEQTRPIVSNPYTIRTLKDQARTLSRHPDRTALRRVVAASVEAFRRR